MTTEQLTSKALTLREWQERVWDTNEKAGWNEDLPRAMGDWISLFHTEASEAYEEHRAGRRPDEIYFGPDGKPEGIPIEVADIVYRALHFFEAYGLCLEDVLEMKWKYNKTRPYRHGDKIV